MQRVFVMHQRNMTKITALRLYEIPRNVVEFRELLMEVCSKNLEVDENINSSRNLYYENH